MNYWIFVARDPKEHNLTARQTYDQRMKDGFWGLGERTPNRQALKKNDKVIFYLAGSEMVFVGTATLESDSFKLTPEQRKSLSHNHPFYEADYGVQLIDIESWPIYKKVTDLIPYLSFIENRQFWGAYFQGGIRRVNEKDYSIIVEGATRTLTQNILRESDLESESDFALEAHLEEFIYNNWERIGFFKDKLELYKIDTQDGRQFPAGEWSIDFLCYDIETRGFVVIELKRGKTSDSVVGQTLRYMSWVKENLAIKGEKVRGIIIARDFDRSLQYAVKDIPTIQVLTYSVDFRLRQQANSTYATR